MDYNAFRNTKVFYDSLEKIARQTAGTRRRRFDNEAYADLLEHINTVDKVRQIIRLLADETRRQMPVYTFELIREAAYRPDAAERKATVDSLSEYQSRKAEHSSDFASQPARSAYSPNSHGR